LLPATSTLHCLPLRRWDASYVVARLVLDARRTFPLDACHRATTIHAPSVGLHLERAVVPTPGLPCSLGWYRDKTGAAVLRFCWFGWNVGAPAYRRTRDLCRWRLPCLFALCHYNFPLKRCGASEQHWLRWYVPPAPFPNVALPAWQYSLRCILPATTAICKSNSTCYPLCCTYYRMFHLLLFLPLLGSPGTLCCRLICLFSCGRWLSRFAGMDIVAFFAAGSGGTVLTTNVPATTARCGCQRLWASCAAPAPLRARTRLPVPHMGYRHFSLCCPSFLIVSPYRRLFRRTLHCYLPFALPHLPQPHAPAS